MPKALVRVAPVVLREMLLFPADTTILGCHHDVTRDEYLLLVEGDRLPEAPPGGPLVEVEAMYRTEFLEFRPRGGGGGGGRSNAGGVSDRPVST